MEIEIIVKEDGEVLGRRTTELWEVAEMNFNSLRKQFPNEDEDEAHNQMVSDFEESQRDKLKSKIPNNYS